MEINFTTFLLFVTPLIISLLLNKLYNSKAPKSHCKLPPCPPKLPLIGHLHHLAFAAALPHHNITKLAQKYGPIMYFQLGQSPIIIISSSQLAKHVLKLHDPTCAQRPDNFVGKILFHNSSDIAFSPYSEYWKRMRQICAFEMLSAKKVRSFGVIRRAEALSLVGSIRKSSGRTINLSDCLFSYSSTVTCKVVFGRLLRERDLLRELVKEFIYLTGGFELVDFFPELKLLRWISWNRIKLLRMRNRLDLILDGIIDERLDKIREGGNNIGDSGGEDIVDVLLRLKKNGRLGFPITIDNIKAIIFDMFSGGTHTSSTTVEWAMAELMRHPRVMAKLQSEIRQSFKEKNTIEESDIRKLKYLKLVIKETLRLHPPAPLLQRSCGRKFELSGYTIPFQAKVFVNIWAIGRDPNHWSDPERFDPERFENSSIDFLGNDFEFIPFGAGSRMCPGMNYGITNVEIPLVHLLYNFDWRFAEQGMKSEDLDMSEVKGLAVSRKDSLLLIPEWFDPHIQVCE